MLPSFKDIKNNRSCRMGSSHFLAVAYPGNPTLGMIINQEDGAPDALNPAFSAILWGTVPRVSQLTDRRQSRSHR